MHTLDNLYNSCESSLTNVLHMGNQHMLPVTTVSCYTVLNLLHAAVKGPDLPISMFNSRQPNDHMSTAVVYNTSYGPAITRCIDTCNNIPQYFQHPFNTKSGYNLYGNVVQDIHKYSFYLMYKCNYSIVFIQIEAWESLFKPGARRLQPGTRLVS